MEGQMDIDSENPGENGFHYPDPEASSLTFPWMGHYQPVPVDAFPSVDAPTVYEGFAPEGSNSGYSGIHGISRDNVEGASQEEEMQPSDEEFQSVLLSRVLVR